LLSLAQAMQASLRTRSSAEVGATLSSVKDVAAQPVPSPEKPALSDDERAARLAMLAKRLRDPDGLDRETLSQIERLMAHEQ
jgi:hypothetical protein